MKSKLKVKIYKIIDSVIEIIERKLYAETFNELDMERTKLLNKIEGLENQIEFLKGV